MNRFYFFITIISLVILSSSCNKRLRYIYNEDQKNDTIYEYIVNSEPYRLKPNDVLHINIITTDSEINDLFKIGDQNNDLNRNSAGGNFYLSGFTVNDSGYVDVPILGSILARGKTVQEFRSDVTDITYKYLNEAIVNVKLVSFKISFLGEVANSGSIFIYQDNIDILEAVSRAGGITEYGKMSNITVVRQEKDKRLVYKLDLSKRELLSSNKFYLYPDDIIIVEPMKAKIAQMNLRDYFFFFSAISSALSTTIIIISLVGN
ncbi:MAG: polysaccharide biosynthesis/export family protein [Bacteroidales bacterium]|nr:polysaccharide biosynthesis/export family protein [Bacteroidales bacterium]